MIRKIADRLWSAIKRKPSRVAVVVSLLLAAANAVLLGTAFSRQRAAEQLAVEVDNLTFSLAQLRQVEQDGLMEMESEAELAEQELETLKANFPALGDRFDLYRRTFALANQSNVDITSVETGGSTIHQTPVGYLSTTSYAVKGQGGFSDCIALMGQLENAGLETLALDQLFLGTIHCQFNVILASSVPASEIDPVEVMGDG